MTRDVRRPSRRAELLDAGRDLAQADAADPRNANTRNPPEVQKPKKRMIWDTDLSGGTRNSNDGLGHGSDS